MYIKYYPDHSQHESLIVTLGPSVGPYENPHIYERFTDLARYFDIEEDTHYGAQIALVIPLSNDHLHSELKKAVAKNPEIVSDINFQEFAKHIGFELA